MPTREEIFASTQYLSSKWRSQKPGFTMAPCASALRSAASLPPANLIQEADGKASKSTKKTSAKEKGNSPSYATLKPICEDANVRTGGTRVQASMRKYVQIPHFNTKLGYNLLAIIHSHEECFVEHAVGVLPDRNTSFVSDRVCCNTCESIHVESDLSLSKILCLVDNKASTREFEEFIIRIPV
jgi:hypothetical protein